MHRYLAAVAALIACMAVPASASADTGTITNVIDNGDGTISATYTTNADCAGDVEGYCFWYPYATEVSPAQACNPEAQPIYVGDYGVHEGPGTETGTDYFYPDVSPVRLCLYISYGSPATVLVAQAVYPATGASPSPPPPEPEVVAAMGVGEAKSYVPNVLKQKYKRKFSRRTLKRSCFRWTTEKVRCNVSWRKGKWKYRGYLMMWNDPADPANRFIYRYKIKRKRVRSHSGGGGSNCDPNYSGCLKPNVSDYDCAGGSGDGPYYTGRVRVIGNDHYDLDRDGDGVACDDPSAFSAVASVKRQIARERAAVVGQGGRGTRTR